MITKLSDHIRPILRKLHLPPIKHRIDFKVATIAYKVRHTRCPAYSPTLQRRSSSTLLLQSRLTRTVIARRAFSQTTPEVWNDLAIDIRNSVTFDHFKSTLRTRYYKLTLDSDCTSWSRDSLLPRWFTHWHNGTLTMIYNNSRLEIKVCKYQRTHSTTWLSGW